MSDLVERLRGGPQYFRVESLRLEAADRIEELETKIKVAIEYLQRPGTYINSVIAVLEDNDNELD